MSKLGIVIGVVAGLVSAVAMGGPRENVGEIAVLISDYYFDAQHAAAIAGDLRREAAAGAFDRFADPDDLAVELTRRLKTSDAHFNVIWESAPGGVANVGPAPTPAGVSAGPAMRARTASPTPPAPSRDMQPVQPQDFETVDRRANFGFRRVERLPGNIAYVELVSVANIDFSRADSPARRAADGALSLVRGADAVILDLRANGGGSPSMVGYLVSAFVEPGKDVFNVFHSRGGTESERPGVPYPEPMLSVPLYVLTSARTASAAEAIAYTLQTCGRAQVVGERSAGAANPGMMFRTPQGFAIFVSTGAPRNPLNGRSWEGDGVRPDTETSDAHALVRAQVLALEGILAGPIGGLERVDAQWALDALRASAHPFEAAQLSGYAGTYGPYAITVAGGALESQRGRQPAIALVPLRKDLFYTAGDPARHFSFVRAHERVVALEVRRSRGDGQRFNRERH
jgi:hypothetical protein